MRLHHAPSQLHERLRRRAHLEPDLEALPLERARDGQHDVRQLGGRVHEQVGMDVEVERGKRLAPTTHVGMGEEQVRAEPDQPADRVGPLLQDCAVHLVRRHPLLTRRAQRPVGQAERASALLRRQQFLAGDVRGRHGREEHVAALGIEAPGEAVDQGDGPRDLGGVALLLEAAPGVVGHRP